MKSNKMPQIIYPDIKSLIKKIDRYANNLLKKKKKKIGEHVPCGYSMSTIWAFDNIENRHTLFICGKIVWKSSVVP